MELKTIMVTQARTSSTRLPGKVLKEIKGKSILKYHLERLALSKNINKIIVATTSGSQDDVLASYVEEWGFEVYRGSENDVLDRFYQSVKNYNADWIVRVTSDCPLIDPQLIDEVISLVVNSGCDYGSNIFIENFPDGQDIEVFKFSALERAWAEAKLQSDREHVTLYIRKNSVFNGGKLFLSVNYPCDADYSKIRMTVDEKVDYDLIAILIEDLGSEKTWLEYTEYIIDKGLNDVNGMIIRNEGLLKSLKND
jgi:spore coat polysaccharide biosynthesis protein SpsF